MAMKITCCLATILILGCASCSNETNRTANQIRHEIHETEGVSVWDRISARSRPERNSPRASLLSLGERFIYLDTFAVDSSYNNTKFLKVRLSDSTDVWVYDFASVLNAKPAVVKEEVPLYLRPDLLTISDSRLQVMEIVAVVEEWDDWIKVVNEKKASTGWIKKEFISYNTIDLAFALLVKRSMAEEDAEQRIENLEGLLENNPYPNTMFVADLRTLLEKEKDAQRESLFEWGRDDRDDHDRRDDNRRGNDRN